MNEPILRVPLSEAEAHKKQLADARATIAAAQAAILAAVGSDAGIPLRQSVQPFGHCGENVDVVATIEAFAAKALQWCARIDELSAMNVELEQERDAARAVVVAAPGVDVVVTLQDLREVLLDEANEDSGVVRTCLEWTEEDEKGDVDVVDSIRELCGRVRQQHERLVDVEADLSRAGGDNNALSARVEMVLETNTRLKAEIADLDKQWREQCDQTRHFAGKAIEWRQKAAAAGVEGAAVDAGDVVAPPKRATPHLDVVMVKLNGDHVITRRDAHGRRYLGIDGKTWGALGDAKVFVDAASAEAVKPRGSKVWSLEGMAQLLEKDAAAEAKKKLAQTTTPTEQAVVDHERDEAGLPFLPTGGAA